MANGDNDALGALALIGGCVGAVLGIVQGFQAHGVGGAIVGGFLGFLAGAIVGAVALLLLGVAIVGLLIYVAVWLMLKLWDLGRP